MGQKDTLKGIGAFILALVISFIVLKFLFELIGVALQLLGFLLAAVIVVIVALPLTVIIKNKLFK